MAEEEVSNSASFAHKEDLAEEKGQAKEMKFKRTTNCILPLQLLFSGFMHRLPYTPIARVLNPHAESSHTIAAS